MSYWLSDVVNIKFDWQPFSHKFCIHQKAQRPFVCVARGCPKQVKSLKCMTTESDAVCSSLLQVSLTILVFLDNESFKKATRDFV